MSSSARCMAAMSSLGIDGIVDIAVYKVASVLFRTSLKPTSLMLFRMADFKLLGTGVMPGFRHSGAAVVVSSNRTVLGSLPCSVFRLKASALVLLRPGLFYLMLNRNCANSAAHLVSIAPNLELVWR